MMRLLPLACVVCVLFSAAATRATPRGHEFREFNCANLSPASMGHPHLWRALNLGMARYDIGWGAVEPKRGQWHFSDYDARLLEIVEQDVPVLGVLAYTAPWAATQKPYSFEYHGRDPSGKMVNQRWEIGFNMPSSPGGMKTPVLTRVDLDSGESETDDASLGCLPPARPSDWLRYVDRVVGRYSNPPWNVKYWQVWNEFNWPEWYCQDWYHFIDHIHIPAARVIRSHDCKVVFGGWACTQGARELSELLQYHDAWRYTDIVDFHYQTNSAFQRVYDSWIRTGKCYGIWTTETGWTRWPGYLPNCYCRLFYWALTHGWERKDQYKVFWFHFTSVPSQPGLTHFGDGPTRLSYIGERLCVLANLLPGKVEPFTNFKCNPELPFDLAEEQPSSEGFLTAHAVVIAFHLPERMVEHTPTVSVRLALPGRVVRVDAVTEQGNSINVQTAFRGSRIQVTVPTDGLKPDVWRFDVKGVTFYVKAQFAPASFG